MVQSNTDFSAAAILARFDRSSAESLLGSIAAELSRLAQANAVLNAKICAMESLQTVVDRIAQAGEEAQDAALPTTLQIDAAFAIPGAWGFHPLEYDAVGRPFRWTGPEQQFSFQFFLNRARPANFSLKFGRLFADVPIQHIRCFVDGEEVDVEISNLVRENEVTGTLPARKALGGSVLTFICPAMMSPESLEGTDDRRLLGLSFYSLRIHMAESSVASNLQGRANGRDNLPLPNGSQHDLQPKSTNIEEHA